MGTTSQRGIARGEASSQRSLVVVDGPTPRSSGTTSANRPSALRVALAGLVGNILEWFDFAVYGYFASDIGRQFFPNSNPAAQQLLAFAVFGVGFFARPFGSVALGIIGDRIGRRTLLTLSIAMIGASTLLLGLLPTYRQIGIAAPVLLVSLRLLQGFSVGGEFTGSMVFTTESSPSRARGFVSSSTAAGVTIGFVLGSASAWLINSQLTADQVASWGWRIPFVASVGLCIAGWFLRRGLHETSEGRKAKVNRSPILRSVMSDWLPMLRTFGIVAANNAAYYLTFTFMVERRRALAAHGSGFLLANTISLVVVLFAKVFGGWLSDRVGRRRLMLILTCAIILLIYPTFALMLSGTPVQFMLGQALIAVPIGMAGGLHGAMLVEMFPLRSRVTSMSIAYSVSLALAGGTAPLICTWLTENLGRPSAPAYYIALLGFIGLALIWPMQETNRRALDQ